MLNILHVSRECNKNNNNNRTTIHILSSLFVYRYCQLNFESFDGVHIDLHRTNNLRSKSTHLVNTRLDLI